MNQQEARLLVKGEFLKGRISTIDVFTQLDPFFDYVSIAEMLTGWQSELDEKTTMQGYITRIIREFNTHAEMADRLSETGNTFDQAFHAFMANAINAAVCHSANSELKDRFSREAV